jgi:hypothetical protein
MEVVYAWCAGLDVHKKKILAYAKLRIEGKRMPLSCGGGGLREGLGDQCRTILYKQLTCHRTQNLNMLILLER